MVKLDIVNKYRYIEPKSGINPVENVYASRFTRLICNGPLLFVSYRLAGLGGIISVPTKAGRPRAPRRRASLHCVLRLPVTQ